MRALFKAADFDESRALDADELRILLRSINVDAEDAEVKDILASLDKDGDGKVTRRRAASARILAPRQAARRG